MCGREWKLKELRENMLFCFVFFLSPSFLTFPVCVMAILAMTLNFYWERFWHVLWCRVKHYSDSLELVEMQSESYSQWQNVWELANLAWLFFRTQCYLSAQLPLIFPEPSFLQNGILHFSNQRDIPERRHLELLACFWQYGHSLFIHIIQQQSENRRVGRNRIWTPAEV